MHTPSLKSENERFPLTTGYEVYLVGGQDEMNSPVDDVIAFDRTQLSLVRCTKTPKALAGFAAVVLPQDCTALRRPGSTATPQQRWYAATVIQRAYRQYQNDGTLKYYFKNKWPPNKPSTTTLNAYCGTGEPGERKYAHYTALRADMDPNLGMLPYMDSSFLKTKSALGLRMTPEWMSARLRMLEQTQQPCDPRFPVILVVGGLDPRNPMGSGTGAMQRAGGARITRPSCCTLGSAVLKYHPFKDQWTLVNAMPEPRNYHAAAYVNDVIIVTEYNPTIIDVFKAIAEGQQVTVYDTNQRTWSPAIVFRPADEHRSTIVQTEDGRELRRTREHLRLVDPQPEASHAPEDRSSTEPPQELRRSTRQRREPCRYPQQETR
ncbi:hypothetical protein HPB49_006398 [Dermacentor silvarum]|uniref:Uncharacterized protein n=1 Tax=Dermacentor silvarum TaxID=543639 RepID=A0ACB8DWN9_DERSI|nr:hypothetical protein HPB49_006398 [Dermacentor silvarum]